MVDARSQSGFSVGRFPIPDSCITLGRSLLEWRTVAQVEV